MPFRRFFRRARGHLIRRYFNKGYRPKIGRIAKDVGFLKSVVNAERKTLNTASTGTILASGATGNTVLVNGISQGDDFFNRDGRSIKVTGLWVQGKVVLNAAATHDTVKVALVLDKQPNGALASFGTIYDLSVNNGGLAPRLTNTNRRFKVLRSKMIDLEAAGNQSHSFKFFIKTGMHVSYQGTTSAITDISTNALLLCFAGTATANMSLIMYTVGCRFIDN